MVNNTELNILKLLASRDDVNWTWYNLDRAMTRRKMEGIGNVAKIINNLSAAGLVDVISKNPAGMDYYHISAQDHKLLSKMRR
ncbi:hypothetical protein JHU04_003295 [Brenneria sp. 4F2]|nr:hypothetical protein [Brenneria bubanii]